MKIEHPVSLTVLQINPDSRMASEGQLNIPREFDRVPDGVLRMDDKPEGVPQAQWKSFLSNTYDAVQAQHAFRPLWDAHRAKLGSVWQTQNQITDAVEAAKANQVWDRVAELLEGTGLRVNPQHFAQGGTIRYHKLFKDDQEVGSVEVPWKASAEEIARAARAAAPQQRAITGP